MILIDEQQYIKGSFEQNSLKDALEAQKGATHAKEFLEYVLPPSVYRAYAKGNFFNLHSLTMNVN
jgi:hypothetical protein